MASRKAITTTFFFGGKVRNFQSLTRGTAKRHGFLCIGAIWSPKGVLGHMGQNHPISKCTQINFGHFFSKYGVFFSAINAGLGVGAIYNPHTARDLQHTPGTPAVHFPLAASGAPGPDPPCSKGEGVSWTYTHQAHSTWHFLGPLRLNRHGKCAGVRSGR